MPRVSRSERRIAELEARIAAKKARLSEVQANTRELFMAAGKIEVAKRQAANSQVLQGQTDTLISRLGGDTAQNVYGADNVLRNLFDPEFVRFMQWSNGENLPVGEEEQKLSVEIRLLEGMIDEVTPIEDKASIWDTEDK
jgi:hypothetical protein